MIWSCQVLQGRGELSLTKSCLWKWIFPFYICSPAMAPMFITKLVWWTLHLSQFPLLAPTPWKSKASFYWLPSLFHITYQYQIPPQQGDYFISISISFLSTFCPYEFMNNLLIFLVVASWCVCLLWLLCLLSGNCCQFFAVGTIFRNGKIRFKLISTAIWDVRTNVIYVICTQWK